jgi:hypothetical protein
MRRSTLLELDGAGNLLLGMVFLLFPTWVSNSLGLPDDASRFYPTVLGAILFGIGVALLLERFRESHKFAGLGLIGALSINLCFGISLAIWLLSTGFELTTPGTIVLWGLVSILVGISGVELHTELKERPDSRAA